MKKTFALLALCASLMPVAAQTNAPAVAHFAHTGQFQRFLLSPDGARVAGLVRIKDRRALVLQKVDGSERSLALALDKPDVDVELLRWMGDTHVLVRVVNYRLQPVDGLSYPSSRLVVLKVGSSKPRFLQPSQEININHISTEAAPACPASEQSLLVLPGIEGDEGVEIFDTRGESLGQAAEDMKGVHGAWWADAQGRLRLAVREFPDGGRELLLRQPLPGNPQKLGRWSTWRKLSAAERDDWQILGFDADPQRLLVRAPHGDAAGVLRLALDQDSPPELLHPLPAGEQVGRLLRNGADCRAVGVQGDRLHLWGDRLAALLPSLEKALPGQEIRLRQWQGSTYVLQASSASEPAEFLIGNRQQGTLARSSWPTWPISGQVAVGSTALGDGATLWHPAGSPRPLPLVVCLGCELHPDDQTNAFHPLRALLISRGFAVLEPRDWQTMSQVRLDQMEQPLGWLDEGLAAARKAGWVDGERIAVMATNSLGGYLGLRWAMQRAEPLRALVLGSALSDLQQFHADSLDHRFGVHHGNLKRRLLGRLEGDALIAASPVANAQRLRAPTLLLHGDRDARLPSVHSRRLESALKKAGSPVRLIRFANSDTDLDHPPYRLEAMEAIEAWLLKYL